MGKNLKSYLKNFAGQKKVTLIGPLCKKKLKLSEFAIEPLIFVDGGADYKPQSFHRLGFSVGDGDSRKKPTLIKLDQTLDHEKDFSDLSFVLQNLPKQFNHIFLYGFLGGRRDHELFNFAEVQKFLTSKKRTRVNFDTVVFAYSRGKWKFNHQGTFSVFSFVDGSLSIDGDCKYKHSGKKPFKAHSSLGLSNVAAGEILIESKNPFFIFI